MSGDTIARIRWRALDRDGTDSCRLARMETGWMLVGHARFRADEAWSALDYVVRCGADWLTHSCDISGTHAGQAVALRFTRDGDDWHLGDVAQPHLQGADDIDLGFTPATNLMPLCRLPEVGRISARAAWLRDPHEPPQILDQTYTRERGGLVEYRAEQTGYHTHLRVDPHGFISHYPDAWEVDHAP